MITKFKTKLLIILSAVIAVLLSLACAFMLAPKLKAHADTEETHDHSAMMELSGFAHVGLTDGEWYLGADANGDITIGEDGEVTLCLNGHTLTGRGTRSVITIKEGAKLTLCDCVGTGVITGGTGNTMPNDNKCGGGVYVDGGTFIMTGGTISENCTEGYGGGVFVENGTLEMTGGAIRENTADFGGGVSIYGGKFTMGGTALISKNTAEASSGGVHVQGSYEYGELVMGGEFIMNGGTISNNTAQMVGGVSIDSDTFGKMTDGTIKDNESTMMVGGVSVGSIMFAEESQSGFEMTGGTICGNSSPLGGGLAVVKGAFKMSGGTISENEQVYDENAYLDLVCGGVYVGNPFPFGQAEISFEISGAPIITGNKYVIDGNEVENNVVVSSGYEITVTDELKDGAKIGLTLADGFSGVLTSGYGENNKDESGNIIAPDTYFVSDRKGYMLILDGGEIALFECVATVTVGSVETVYNSIEEAWTAANNAEAAATVKMYADVETTDTLTVEPGKNITLDLNGCMIKYNNSETNGSVITVSENANFTLCDCVGTGVITGGTGTIDAEDNKFAHGGGVYVCGTFTMSGGKISGNTATGSGGGVWVDGGTFEMTDGTISENNAYIYGGGVFLTNCGEFTMSGGFIDGNNAVTGCGGISVGENCTFTMTGGDVVNNASQFGGVGVFGTFNVAGNPKITGNKVIISGEIQHGTMNVDLQNNAKITVTGELTFGAKIGVSNSGAVATGFTQSDKPSNYFIPDVSSNNCVFVSNAEDGTVSIGTHDFDNAPWLSNEATHWKDCKNGCGHFMYSNSHTFNQEIVDDAYLKAAATCTAKAVYYKSCATCGAHGTDTFEVGEALGHDKVQHDGKAATCTEKGWNAYETCSRCDYTTYKEVAALGHTLTHIAENAATEDKEGNKEYWSCDNCGKYFADADGKEEITDKDSVVIPKLTNTQPDERPNESSPSNVNTALWITLIVILCAIILGELVVIAFLAKRNKNASGKDGNEITQS